MAAAGISYAVAVGIQERLRERLTAEAPRGRIRYVGGADVSFALGGDVAVAGIIVFTWPRLEVVDVAVAVERVDFPYVPGLLSFREVPVIRRAWEKLHRRPEVLFCDGQGYAHPRRMGLACHLGVVLKAPTIGVAKSILVGSHGTLGERAGSTARLVDAGEVVGRAVRTADGVNPVYVSRGNMMNLATAVRLVLKAGRGYRLPEPTRLAHQLVTRVKKATEETLASAEAPRGQSTP